MGFMKNTVLISLPYIKILVFPMFIADYVYVTLGIMWTVDRWSRQANNVRDLFWRNFCTPNLCGFNILIYGVLKLLYVFHYKFII